MKFSPDGKRLAVAGGLPGRMGEIQIWDVEKRKLTLSHSVTYDTLYGASWSPDGKLIAFGCGDNSVRVIEADSAKQVLFMNTHTDWALDTTWSLKGDHVISVSRDMTAKLTEFATQRFIDNITSITPGALRGGMHSVVRHPEQDNILVGGSGNDLLIGGFGQDTLLGNAADDILIGGITDYDSNATALNAILAKWNGSGSYQSRVNDLKTGSLRDAAALAGYVDGASGQRFVLVAMANHANAAAARTAWDALVDWTAAQ